MYGINLSIPNYNPNYVKTQAYYTDTYKCEDVCYFSYRYQVTDKWYFNNIVFQGKSTPLNNEKLRTLNIEYYQTKPSEIREQYKKNTFAISMLIIIGSILSIGSIAMFLSPLFKKTEVTITDNDTITINNEGINF